MKCVLASSLPISMASMCFRFRTLNVHQRLNGMVCKSWRSVMLARRSLCRPPPLLATLKTRWSQTPGFREEEVSLSCLIDDKIHSLSLDIPALVFGESDRFYTCLGNSYGWLHVKRKRIGWGSPAYLLSILSGEIITLPETSDPLDDITRVALSSPPTSGCCMIAIMRNIDISVTNAKLAYWRIGDGEWTVIAGNGNYNRPIIPVCMAFHKGKFYVQVKGVTEVYRLDGPHGPEFEGVVDDWVYENHTDDLDDVHLVGTEELFLVARVVLTKFEVFKLDGRRWVKITDLGDQSLFISRPYNRRHTHCYRTGEIMGLGLRPNCIYCLEGRWSMGNLSVYSMEDGSIKELLPCSQLNFLMMHNEWDIV